LKKLLQERLRIDELKKELEEEIDKYLSDASLISSIY